jgi:outer membrane lipoprotein SlyB
VVESVRVVEVRGDKPNVLGTIAGGVLGGVLGHQMGGGSGKDLATIAGAVGGAYAGNRIENSRDVSKLHRVVVRMDSGASRSIDLAADPDLKTGAAVRIESGGIVRL